ncbi:hypothetical protein EYF80_004360 [Liparis tanakae]|uniref:Uncharacterized protein n=1 Tax=Liparis tanakae TaxID=230148 RepID=A0A4Z2J6R0_9TELE|nr:hypothetical protein EYF80_004360 [Liparis tanakae]
MTSSQQGQLLMNCLAAGFVIVKSFDGEAGEHLVHQQRARVRVVQCGRLDEDGVAAAVVDPHPVRLTCQLDAVADLGPHHLHQLGLVVGAELAQAEAVPLSTPPRTSGPGRQTPAMPGNLKETQRGGDASNFQHSNAF